MRNNKINNKETSDKNKDWLFIIKTFGNSVVGLATLAASIATCVTLWEMRSERNQSYKPYLIIESQNYNEEFEKPFYSIDDTNNLVKVLSIDENDLIPMSITINNIGSGTATDIEIMFSESQCKKCWEEICSYYSDYSVNVTDSKIHVDYNSANYDRMLEYEHYMNGDVTLNRSYILSEESIEISIPEEYRRIIHALAYCTKGDYTTPFIIELEISYNDLQGINYQKKYQLNIEAVVELDYYNGVNYTEYTINCL